MPVSMTYASLQSDIRSYVERGYSGDTTVYAQIPSLINLAERNIARELKILGFVEAVTTTFTAGVSTVTKPTRWRETISMFYGAGQTRTPIFPRAWEYCRMYWPDPSLTAAPLFYADYDYSHWLISPTPDSAYNVEILYYQLPALLDDANTTNWLTEYAPQVLLYGALLETAIFLKDQAAMQSYQASFSQAMAALSGEDVERIVDRTSTRQKP